MTRKRVYSNIGKRIVVKIDICSYKKYNLLCVIKYDKFIDFLNKNIKNKYKNYLLLLDNAKFYYNKNVKDL